MGIGASIFLIAAGAILAFAISPEQISFVNLPVVGWILMLVGVLGLVMTTMIWGPRRRSVVRERRTYSDQPPQDPPVAGPVRPTERIYEEHLYDDRG